ncbi:MAG: hypothetical protein ACM31C_15095 [Acidobacteriota bacterium]
MTSHARILSLLIVTACTSSHHGAGSDAAGPMDAIATPQQCEATFEMAFARPCSTAADCVVMAHSDCCHEIDIGVTRCTRRPCTRSLLSSFPSPPAVYTAAAMRRLI